MFLALFLWLPVVMAEMHATSADHLVISHFCRQIFSSLGYPDKGTAILKKKWRVAATAAWYFRQFYTKFSLLDHDPRLLMLCCMFLAGKSEDSFVNIKDLFRIYNKISEERILACEIVLLEGLEFNLKVFHPQNCVYSIIADVKRQEQASGAAGLSEQQAAERKQRVSTLMTTWLATCEESLAILQSSALILELNPLCAAICTLSITAPPGLQEIVDFPAYIEGKFGAEYAAAEVGTYTEAVHACILRECNEEQQNVDAEQLHAAMLELKKRNRWKKGAAGV